MNKLNRLIMTYLIYSILWTTTCQASNIVMELAQLSIEDLMEVTVSSVGFFDLPPEQVPGSIQIITTEQLENSPATGLADMLDLYVSGIHVGNSSRNGASYAVRGIQMPDNSTTVFMFDGQNINSGAGLGVNMNLDLPLLGDISQLEVIKGPCALVHGSGAMNGFVNIVPKNGTDYPGAYWNVQYGFREQQVKMEHAYGHSYGYDKDIFVYFGMIDAEGFSGKKSFGYEKTQPELHHDYNYHCRFFDTSYRWSMVWNHNNFHLTSLLQNDQGSSNAIYPFLKSPMEYYQGSFLASLSWESHITPYESLEWHFPISFIDLGLIGQGPGYHKSHTNEEGGAECHIENRLIIKTHRLPNHAIAFGGLFGKRHFRAGDYYLKKDPDNDGRLLDSDWHEFGLFFEDIFHITPQWILLFGFRHDTIENDDFNIPEFIHSHRKQTNVYKQEYKDVSTFRLATSYGLSPDDTIKLSLQEGYHQANMFNYYEIFYGSTILQDDMPFELMQSLEFNYTHNEPDHGLAFGVNLYLNSYENSILVNTVMQENMTGNELMNPTLESDFLMDEIFGNGPSFASIGGEFDMNWDMTSNTHLFFSYAYTQPHDMDENKNTVLSVANDDCTRWLTYPRHIIKGAIRHKTFNDRLSLNLHANYSSAIEVLSKSRMKKSQYYPPLMKVHASISLNLTDQLSFQVIGRNIFDNDTPPVSFHFYEPWEGNLGEDSPFVYMSLTWKE
ncbi:MAG: hypothetical protein OMM_03565 [Candidatus Magnetoglobus multicellularis str. Araruama]|uniref:TonB-dependent receptor n=1 Tax=Candidatus Magnetoglobus multicellularis str. Araruama TaxID=890399 RepID=A0A1V1P527_9BACT|nr:MAG: hypothetical protein OMM_03565 [Candidatus Magnetoglobus multicellularis str. Araruama]